MLPLLLLACRGDNWPGDPVEHFPRSDTWIYRRDHWEEEYLREISEATGTALTVNSPAKEKTAAAGKVVDELWGPAEGVLRRYPAQAGEPLLAALAAPSPKRRLAAASILGNFEGLDFPREQVQAALLERPHSDP